MDRRRQDLHRVGRLSVNPQSMAQSMSQAIESQLAATKTQVQDLTRRFVIDLIREKEPDIPDEALEALLTEWLPTPEQKVQKQAKRPQKTLPPEMVLSMLQDFLDYSLGTMTPSKQALMRDSLGSDWVNEIWGAFPQRVRGLVQLLLKEKIPPEVFWDEVKATLDGQRE